MADFTIPPQSAPDSEKNTKEWGLKMFRYMYGRHSEAGQIYVDFRKQWEANYLYMEGRQPESMYKDQFMLNRGAGGPDESYMNVNFEIISPLPKFMDLVVKKVCDARTRIVVNAVNPVAITAKDEKLLRMQTEIANREFLMALQDEFGIQAGMDPQAPQTMEDLEMYLMQGNLKLAEEMAAELGIEMVMGDDKWAEILPQLVTDMFCTGFGVTTEYEDTNGQLRVRADRPQDCLLDYSYLSNYKDARWGGVFRRYTEAEFRAMASKYYEREKIDEIVQSAMGRTDPYWMFQNNYTIEQAQKYIVVLEGWFYSTNKLTLEEKQYEEGKTEVKLRPEDWQPPAESKYSREKIQKEYQVIYKGSWVVGTDYLMNYGLQKNRGGVGYKATPNQHIIIHKNRDGFPKPMAQGLTPFADEIQISWLKFQNLVAKEPPPGFAISSEAAIGVSDGKGGSVNLGSWIQQYLQNGNLLYNPRDRDGAPIQGVPIVPLNPNFAAAQQQQLNNISQCIELIRQMLGFNEISDASTPNTKMLVGVSEQATLSTNSAIWPLANSIGRLKIDTAKSVVCRLKTIVKNREYGGVMKIGEDAPEWMRMTMGIGYKFMAVDRGMADFDYEFEVEEQLTDAQKAKVDEWIKLQLSVRQQQGGVGGITMADAMMVERCRTMKQAMTMLDYREKKRKEEDMATKQQEADIQLQSNQQSQQAAMEAKQMEIQMLAQLEMQKAAMIEAERRKTLEVEYGFEMELQRLKNQGLVMAQTVSGQFGLEKAEVTAKNRPKPGE